MSDCFIDIDTAAKRSGRSVGHLRRLCKDKWASERLARLEPPAGGGKPTWMIREDADPSLARVRFPEQIGTDLRQFPQAKRDEALRRRSILIKWQEHLTAASRMGGFTRRQATGHFLERLLINENVRLSERTLHYWEQAYRTAGLAGLIDERGTKKEKAADPFLDEVKRLWLNPNKPTLAFCIELAIQKAREQGWAVRNYMKCKRMKDSIPAAVVYKMRGGEEAYVNHAEPYLEGDFTSLQSNELWNADHHQFDVLVKISERTDSETGEAVIKHVRPWLTAFQDVRSRKIMGWHVYAHDPNSDAIFTTLRYAIGHGVPENLLIDNGKDFDCYALNGRTKKDRWLKRKVRFEVEPKRLDGVFAALEIGVGHAKPYHGQSKPIERWFGFLETRTTGWPTYCGNSPGERREDLQLQIERGKAPTLEDFIAWFGEWVTAYNAGHHHSGQGMAGKTPNQVHAENLLTIRTASRELTDVLLMKRICPVKVGQNGVTWQGMRYGQFEPSLQRMLGKDVALRIDERDITRVQVYTPDDVFVCIAGSNMQIPKNASSQDLRDASAEKRRSRAILKEFVQQRPRMSEDLPDRMIRAAAEKARIAEALAKNDPQGPPPSPSIRPIRHAIEDQLPALQRAMQRDAIRVAVGAESTSIIDVSRFVSDPEPASSADSDDAFARLGMKFRSE